MQAPSFRMNEREPNPNTYIAFIRSLKDKEDNTDAEGILKAIAAQMKKIMEKRFMFVGTLEEAEFNRVFAGRNWNHGQSIELVLRGPSGRFLPLPYITSVMCHEMAHIEQMNHGPKFLKLMAEIKADVKEMQARGYYGDGFWSDGRRLRDSVKMGAEGLRPSDFPEYVCGITAGDARKAKRPRGGPRASAGPSLVKGEASVHSGRQTDYNRKAGRRNNAKMGDNGSRLDGGRTITKEDRDERKKWVDERAERLIAGGFAQKTARTRAGKEWVERNPWWTEGSTRGKVAKSKTAAEMRATAAEARLVRLTGTKVETKSEDGESSDDEPVDDLEDEEADIDDPHLDPEKRKREMESEMNDDERCELRGGWEEYVTGGSKRTRSSSQEEDGNGVRKRLGRAGASSEPEKYHETLGMEKVTDSGKPSEQIGDEFRQHTRALPDDRKQGWDCKLCTFRNLQDHGRCDMCQARPDGTLPSDIESQ